jgi:hypothetical protein
LTEWHARHGSLYGVCASCETHDDMLACWLQDFDERRHLLRLWISPQNDRPLPEVYSEILGGSVEVGNRGGIHLEQGYSLNVPLEAE